MIVDLWSLINLKKNPLILLKIISRAFSMLYSTLAPILNFQSMNQEFYKNYDSKNPFENLGKQAKVQYAWIFKSNLSC